MAETGKLILSRKKNTLNSMSQQSSPFGTDLFEAFETLPKTEIASFNSRRLIIDGTFLIITELEVRKLDVPSLLFSRSKEGTGEEIPTFVDKLMQLSALKDEPCDFFLVSLIFYMKWRF